MITNDGWFIAIVMPFLAPIEASQPRRGMVYKILVISVEAPLFELFSHPTNKS
jgi:hypothetical protein